MSTPSISLAESDFFSILNILLDSTIQFYRICRNVITSGINLRHRLWVTVILYSLPAVYLWF